MAHVRVLGVAERKGQGADGERTLHDITVEVLDGAALPVKVGDEMDLSAAVESVKAKTGKK